MTRWDRPGGRLPARFALWAGMLLLLLLAGCSVGGGLSPGEGGLAAEDTAELSLVLAQTRAQFPELSVRALDYRARPLPERPLGQRAALALRGEGRSISPGVQVGRVTPVTLSLYLDKRHYAAGEARIRVGDGPEQRWRVVAYDKRGDADGRFEFMYALVAGDGGLRYLVLLGGPYREQGRAYWGAEGTLVVPGPERSISDWERAYKLDFGFRQPAEPPWRESVARARRLFRELRADVPALSRLQAQVDEAERALQAAGQAAGEGAAEGDAADGVEAAEQALAEAERRYRQVVQETGQAALRYWSLREEIAGAFAAFLESNRYLWQRREAQVSHFETWEAVERHHPRIDELTAALAAHLDDPRELERRRREALETVRRHDNWSRHPDRQDAEQPAQAPTRATEPGEDPAER